jgi:hypothetical protein
MVVRRRGPEGESWVLKRSLLVAGVVWRRRLRNWHLDGCFGILGPFLCLYLEGLRECV